MKRTFTVTCPHCAVDVVVKPRSTSVDLDLHGLTARVEFIAGHLCARDDRGTSE